MSRLGNNQARLVVSLTANDVAVVALVAVENGGIAVALNEILPNLQR